MLASITIIGSIKMKISNEQYDVVVSALKAKGYTVDTVYEALKQSGFSVKINGELYERIYAARVIAMMHSAGDKAPLEL